MKGFQFIRHSTIRSPKHTPCVITSFKGLLQDESDLSMVRTSDVFDPNKCKLMEKSVYDFSKPPSLGHVFKAKPYMPNNTQKLIQTQGGGLMTLRIGLGYMPS